MGIEEVPIMQSKNSALLVKFLLSNLYFKGAQYYSDFILHLSEVGGITRHTVDLKKYGHNVCSRGRDILTFST